jgi:hypothetical protein
VHRGSRTRTAAGPSSSRTATPRKPSWRWRSRHPGRARSGRCGPSRCRPARSQSRH